MLVVSPRGGVKMPRWLYGSLIVIYLAGTFGFGLARQISGIELDIGGAMSYGAAWPLTVLKALNVL